jgi:hypothetical protein
MTTSYPNRRGNSRLINIGIDDRLKFKIEPIFTNKTFFSFVASKTLGLYNIPASTIKQEKNTHFFFHKHVFVGL